MIGRNMPNCFDLTRKGFNSPATLESVDRALCQYFELEYSERRYVYGWFDDIGFALACGKTFAEIIDRNQGYLEKEPNGPYSEHERMMVRFAAYLNEHYIANSWAEIGRR
jgi:hypothetical protein